MSNAVAVMVKCVVPPLGTGGLCWLSGNGVTRRLPGTENTCRSNSIGTHAGGLLLVIAISKISNVPSTVPVAANMCVCSFRERRVRNSLEYNRERLRSSSPHSLHLIREESHIWQGLLWPSVVGIHPRRSCPHPPRIRSRPIAGACHSTNESLMLRLRPRWPPWEPRAPRDTCTRCSIAMELQSHDQACWQARQLHVEAQLNETSKIHRLILTWDLLLCCDRFTALPARASPGVTICLWPRGDSWSGTIAKVTPRKPAAAPGTKAFSFTVAPRPAGQQARGSVTCCCRASFTSHDVTWNDLIQRSG